MSARRVSDHEIPAVVKDVFDWTLIVGAFEFGGKKVTAYGVMTVSDEGITNATAVFASN